MNTIKARTYPRAWDTSKFKASTKNHHTANTITPINNPDNNIWIIISRSNKLSVVFLGFSFIIVSVSFSKDKAISWSPSVTKFNHKSCIATSGIGKLNIIDKTKNSTSANPHDRSIIHTFLILE